MAKRRPKQDKTLFNPFIHDKPLLPEQLIDREEEIAQLLRLAQGGHNCRLSAPRRYGKTSLLRKLLTEADQLELVPTYVNFYGAVSLGDVATRFDEAYREQLKGGLRQWLSGRLQLSQPRLRAGLPGGLAGVEVAVGRRKPEATRELYSLLDLPNDIYKRTGKKMLIVFDEFQTVLSINGGIDGLIRSRIELHNKSAAYVFAGSHPGMMEQLFGSRDRPFYGQARAFQLYPLRGEDLAVHIGEQFTNTGRDVTEVLDSLISLTRGHPQRAMLLAHHIWEATPAGTAADSEVWERALTAVYSELQESFKATWEALKISDQRVLSALSTSTASLLSKANLQNFELAASTAEQARDRLVALGHLALNDQRRPYVVDPLFEVWLGSGRRSLT